MMVEKLLREKGLQTAKWVISRLIERRLVDDRSDAIKKLSDVNWIASHGFGHVADLLMSDTGKKALDEVFIDSESQKKEE